MTPLHWIGETLRGILLEIPMPVVRGIFVVLLAALLVWILSLPKEATRPPETSRGAARAWEDLRWWAAAALVIQLAIYLTW
jgi:hypothetical protein